MIDMPVPLVTGATAGGLFVGDVIQDPQLAKVFAFLSQLPEENIQSLSEINISNPDDVSIYAGSVQIRLGALDELAGKVEVTQSVLKELREAKHPIAYVDARFEVYSVRLKQ